MTAGEPIKKTIQAGTGTKAMPAHCPCTYRGEAVEAPPLEYVARKWKPVSEQDLRKNNDRKRTREIDRSRRALVGASCLELRDDIGFVVVTQNGIRSLGSIRSLVDPLRIGRDEKRPLALPDLTAVDLVPARQRCLKISLQFVNGRLRCDRCERCGE
ncbi:hypothetical protein [Mycoplana ramosa]|uniref:Uncharacterized protein n=1 Tax=Mycoplana ramosa TaxID=40837 RepID=A0ABW3YSE7_MYCRA